MRKKYLPIILLLVILPVMSIMFFGCKPKHMAMDWWDYNETTHWHNCTACNDETFDNNEHIFENGAEKKKCTICGAEIPYNDEENYAIWYDGIIESNSYKSDFTYLYSRTEFENNEYSSEMSIKEFYSLDKYRMEYLSLDDYENGEWTYSNSEISTVKKVQIDGKEKFKQIYESNLNGKKSKSGKIVRSDYIKNIAQNNPSEVIEDFGITEFLEANTYTNFCTTIEEIFNNIGTFESKSYSFTRSKTGQVNFNLSYSYSEHEEGRYEDSDYLITQVQESQSSTIENGKLKYLTYTSIENIKFEDETKNVLKKDIQNVEIKYSFDYDKFDDISMETETTKNECYANILFDVNGYYLSDEDSVLVDETYTYNDAVLFLINIVARFIIYNGNINGMFEVYQDKEMMQVFNESLITESGLKLYIKLIPPENKSMILTINQSRDNLVKFVHVFEIGSTYNFDDILSGYNVLSIDGLDATNKTELLCEENKIYTLIVEEIN